MDLHDELARIAQLQGKEAIDGTRLEGFGPDDAPPPAFEPVTYRNASIPPEWLDEPAAEPTVLRSPDDPAASPPPTTPSPGILGALEQAVAGLPSPVLVVVEGNATYRGHTAQLTDAEQKAVAAVIVRALKRQLADIEGQLGKQARRRSVRTMIVPPVPDLPKRKPGRPRKVEP